MAQQKASTALNTKVEVQDFVLNPSKLKLDLYGVTVHGAASHPDPPLLQAEHIGVGVDVSSLLHRQWYVNNIEVERPVMRVVVDAAGNNNIPEQRRKSSPGQTNIFDLGIRHAVLTGGEVYYNNEKSTMNADLHELQFKAMFDATAKRYSGSLGYQNGHLQIGVYNPIPHGLDAKFEATPNEFVLKNATLRSGRSQFLVNATVTDYGNPEVHAIYSAALDIGEFRQILKNPTVPTGTIELAGNMQYQSLPNLPALEGVRLAGRLNSRALEMNTPSFRGAITGIAARYGVANGNLTVSEIRAGLLGGELTGTVTMRDMSGMAPQSLLRAKLSGVSLADAQRQMKSAAVRQVRLSGTLNADANATWGKTLANLVAHTDATLNAAVAPAQGANGSIPLNGVIHAGYAAVNQQLSVNQSYLRTPQTSLTLNGTVSKHSSLQVRLDSRNLHELENAAQLFSPPQNQTQQMGLYGRALFNGTVTGSTEAPQLAGTLTAASLRIKDSAWRALRANVSLNPSLASVRNGQLEPADRGRINFDFNAALRHWQFSNANPIEANLQAQNVNAAEVARLSGSQTPVRGTLTANVALRGSELNPAGQGSVTLTNAKIAAEPVQSVNLKFQGTGEAVQGNLSVRIPAGAAQADFKYLPKEQGYTINASAPAIRLDQIQTLKDKNLKLGGVLAFEASGRGTAKDPQLVATAKIPTLQVQNQTVKNFTMQTNVANHVANVALDSEAVSTSLKARATVQLAGDYPTVATLDTAAIPLEPLIAMYAPTQSGNITGTTEIHANLRGPLKNKAAMDAHLVIPVLQLKYKNLAQIAAANPIRIDYANQVINLERTTIEGTDTHLEMQGQIPTSGTQPASLLLLGNVDLKLAELISPDITSGGQLRFNVNSFGARTDPNVQGKIEVVNATFASGDMPIGLQNGNGVITLTKDRAEITQFQGEVGGGTVSASGAVTYRPALQFNLGLEGKGVRMLYPAGVREGLDTHLALLGTPESSTLSGTVRIDQLSFTPDFDLNEFIGQFSGGTVAPPAQGMAQNVKMNLTVESTNGLNLVSRTLSLQGTAHLQVQGTAAEPVILGRVNLTGGDLIFMSNRYVLQGGTLDFVNPSETQPVVNVTANTTIQQYTIHLRFNGPTDHMQTSYTSDPALPPSDIINLLAFGQTTEAAGANPQPGNLGAESVIASGLSSQVTSRVEKIAGISQLSIDPVLGGTAGQQNPGARVTIQQRVTGNLFVTFSTDVTSTQRQAISLQYNLSPRVSITGTRDQNGGFGFQTRIRSR